MTFLRIQVGYSITYSLEHMLNWVCHSFSYIRDWKNTLMKVLTKSAENFSELVKLLSTDGDAA